MATICRTVQESIETTYTENVESWVNKQSAKCKRSAWWKPWKWLCWLVWVLVKIITVVVYTVIQIVSRVLCHVVSWVLLVGFTAVGSVVQTWCHKCWIVDWANIHFGSDGNCEQIEDKRPSLEKPDQFVYTFICKCGKNEQHKVTVTTFNDEIAAELVRTEGLKKCGITPAVVLSDATIEVDSKGTSYLNYVFDCTCKPGDFPTKITIPKGFSDSNGLSDALKEAKKQCRSLCS